MKYQGSKNRISKDILPIILEHKSEAAFYIEPFVGGGNMIDKVDGIERIGYDCNQDAIDGLIAIRDNVHLLPKDNKEFTEDDYKNTRGHGHILQGYISFALSYGGKHWGGWRRDSAERRDYVKEAYNNAVKQSPKLKGVTLIHRTNILDCSFSSIKRSIIYCDPPYKATTKYKHSFDHVKFWDWVRDLSTRHWVYVSEYEAPDDFKCIWKKEIASSLTKNTGSKKGKERLFIYEKVFKKILKI